MPIAKLRKSAAPERAALRAGILVAAACFLALVPATPLRAQKHKNKVPLLGKLTSNQHQQAYSGTVQSLDIKQKILSVNSRKGRDTEIFPVKKSVHVETLNGKKIKLKTLTPGTKVLIYYDQKHGERTIRYIVVLDAGTESGKTQTPPAT